MRFFTRVLARIGYCALTLLILQTASLLLIAILQYAIVNHIQQPDANSSRSVSDFIYVYGAPLDIVEPDKTNFIIVAFLWTALAAVIVALVFYTSNIASALLKRLLRHQYGKVTYANLFAAKFIIPGIAYIIVSLLALLLPAIYLLLPMNAAIALICLVCFGLQYRFVHRLKIPIAKIL